VEWTKKEGHPSKNRFLNDSKRSNTIDNCDPRDSSLLLNLRSSSGLADVQENEADCSQDRRELLERKWETQTQDRQTAQHRLDSQPFTRVPASPGRISIQPTLVSPFYRDICWEIYKR
jgi:hypothetical protein